MFWKTCLTHAGEIFLALAGAWILGYLWNRWFGSRTDPRQIAEYEDQIKSLRDRIKLQDQEIKAGLVRQDAWSSEFTDLKDSNTDLKNRLETIDSSYQHHLTPAAQKSIQDRLEYEATLKQDQIAALTEQNRDLTETLQSLEARLIAFQIQEDEFGQTQSKLQIAEARLLETQTTLTNLENQFKELTDQQKTADETLRLHVPLTELENSRKDLEFLELKYQEQEKQVQELLRKNDSDALAVNELTKKLEETRQISMELENKYIQQLHSREEELSLLNNRLNLSPLPDKSSLENITSDLSNARQEVTSLQHKLKHLESIHSEQDPMQSQRLQEIQMLNQQLNNELIQAQGEIRDLTGKLNNYAVLEKNAADWAAKSKEWEARWKDAAKESEQFKVAHASLIKEKDGQKQHLAQLEADILQFNSVFKDYESKEEQWNQRIESLTADLGNTQSENENKLAMAYQAVDEASKKLSENQDNIKALLASKEDWAKKHDFLLQNLTILQTQKEDADQIKAQQRFMFQELEYKLKNAEADLVVSKLKLAESANLALPAHKEADWDLVLKSKEEELKLAQQTISELVSSNENKLDKLNEVELQIPKMESALNSLTDELGRAFEKLKFQENLIADWETKNENLLHELQLAKSHLTEMNQLKENQSASLGNWEQLYAESQKMLAVNKQQFSENEKNNQAMETLVAEWEKKYHLVQNELLDVQHQLSEIQQLQDSRDEVEVDREHRQSDLENSLEDTRLQLVKYQSLQNEHQHLIDEWEEKYDELYNRFNIVQLQYADTQRLKSHLESDMRKASDYQAKYQAESKGWQKRLADLEADYQDQLATLQSKEYREQPIISEPLPVTNLENSSSQVSPLEKEKGPEMKTSMVKAKTVRLKKPPKINPLQISQEGPELAIKPKGAPKTIIVMDLKKASTILSKKVKENDHKIIEGIGPKISSFLKRNKISTWQALSQLPVKKIQNLLNKEGTKFALAEPKTWPVQAKLAAAGKWSRLKKFQDKLKLNKPAEPKTKAKAQPPVKKAVPVLPKKNKRKVNPKPKQVRLNLAASSKVFGRELILNDLKVIEGIGPKIERILVKENILTWTALAKTKLRPLRALLKKAGNNFVLADPVSWSSQARLASRGQWKRLKTLQDKLNSRK
ncbi:MAG: hypothetical protein SH818_04370 [Saprospiraceae bacterium]|nr:hypothetical protein [Saprospiraceae bacterium]